MQAVTTKPVPILVPILAWIAGAVALAASGALLRAPQLVPIWVVGSVAAAMIAYRRSAQIRGRVAAIDTRWLVLVHAIRLPIGLAFLHEAAAGRLAPVFAHRAGYGDAVVGALAIVVGALLARRRGAVLAFSVIGLADIAVAIGTGMYLLLVARDPQFAVPIAALPFPLVPLCVVPLVIVAHAAAIARLTSRTARSCRP